MNDSLFTTLVKVDHIIFKHNTYSTIIHENADNAAASTDHHHCRMGIWYYQGEGKQLFSSTQAYKAMEAPHKAVHDLVADTITCVTRKDCRNVKTKESIVKNMQLMEQNSVQLFDLLEKMVAEANPA
ncbi:MAG TPA: CZB domain-containing protein [Sulfuricurvum sp.]|nr:CZB domain-containing protein [Sulfuricurvum sp.]